MTNVLPKFRIFKFLKRDCGTIPVAEITSDKIEFFSRFLIATESSKYLLIFVINNNNNNYYYYFNVAMFFAKCKLSGLVFTHLK
jgi:hypothetical protein